MSGKLLCVAVAVAAMASAAMAQEPSSGPAPQAVPALNAPLALNLTANTPGLELSVKQALLTAQQGKVVATTGSSLLVLQTQWKNRLDKPYEIPQMASHVYVVLNGRRLATLHERAQDVQDHIPLSRLRLDANGGLAKGLLVFDLPPEPVASLELRFFDSDHGDAAISLAGREPGDKPVAPLVKNTAVEMGVYEVHRQDTYGGRKAPFGMMFLVMDVRGRSIAKDRAGKDAFTDIPHWREYLTAIIDGEYAYAPQMPAGREDWPSAMPQRPRWIPGAATGAEVVFLAPAKSSSLELRFDFPSLEKGADGSQALVVPLEGKSTSPPERVALMSFKDEMFEVQIVGQQMPSHIGGVGASRGRKLLVLEVSVRNTGAGGQWFQTRSQLHYLGPDKRELSPDTTIALPHPSGDKVWLPPGAVRTFEVLFQIAAQDSEASLKFIGGKEQKLVPLRDLGDSTAVSPASRPAGAAASGPASQAALAPVQVGAVQVFDPSLKPQALAGVGLTQAEVDAAVLKGRKFLLASLKARLAMKDWQFEPVDVLMANALVHAGALEEPEFAGYAARLAQELRSRDIVNNYVAGLEAMLGESLGNIEAAGCRRALMHILESQGPKGSWSYESSDSKTLREMMDAVKAPPAAAAGPFKVAGGQPIVEAGAAMSRTTKPEFGADGDNSVTQFAVLGLWSAARSGLAIDKGIWQRCLQTTRARQGSEGGCGYHDEPDGYGSMTCAYICTVAICLDQLGGDPRQDAGIHRALAWLVQNWSVEKNPGHANQIYYYLYSIERVGRILDVDFIGPHEWYPLGARQLLKTQKPDGSWKHESGSDADARCATSFALLFLTKATAKLTPKARGGDGVLATTGPSLQADRIYFILDASSSMLGDIGPKTRFQIATESLEAIAKSLPDQTQVALRVYGNRLTDHANGPDEDSTLEIPLAKLDRKAFAAKLRDLIPRGKTPLAYSMEQAAEDLKKARITASSPVSVVLLTDGWESTGKNRDPVAAARTLAAVDGAMLNVVGLAVDNEQEVKQLQDIASAAGGQYWAAGSGEKLIAHLKAAVFAVPGRFSVYDAAGSKVADGSYGQNITLKEGKYTLKAVIEGKEVQQVFWINTGQTTTLSYEPAKAAAPSAPKAAPAPKATTPPAKPAPKPSRP